MSAGFHGWSAAMMCTRRHSRDAWAQSPCPPACWQRATPVLTHSHQGSRRLPQRQGRCQVLAKQRRKRLEFTLAATLRGSCRTCTTAWLLPLLRSGVRLKAQHQELSLKLSIIHKKMDSVQVWQRLIQPYLAPKLMRWMPMSVHD